MKEAIIHEKKNRLYFFKQPFKHFNSTFKNAPAYRKFTMLLNFALPGRGNLLIGSVEIGLAVLAVFIALVVGEVYLVQAFMAGTIVLSAVDATVDFGLLNVSLIALYFSAFKLNVSLNYKLNNGLDAPKSVIAKSFKNWINGLKAFWQNWSYQYQVSKKKKNHADYFFLLNGYSFDCL